MYHIPAATLIPGCKPRRRTNALAPFIPAPKASTRKSPAGAKLAAPHGAESLKAVVIIDESGTPRLVHSSPHTEVPALCTLAEVAAVLDRM